MLIFMQINILYNTYLNVTIHLVTAHVIIQSDKSMLQVYAANPLNYRFTALKTKSRAELHKGVKETTCSSQRSIKSNY